MNNEMKIKFKHWEVKDHDHSTGIAFLLKNRIVLLGFGWEDEQPLRPWPQIVFRYAKDIPWNYRIGYCISFCGLFINTRLIHYNK